MDNHGDALISIRPLARDGDDERLRRSLIRQVGLRPIGRVDVAYGAFADDRLVATAARADRLIEHVAILPTWRGGSLFDRLMTRVMSDAFCLGHTKLFVCTVSAHQGAFGALGFHPVVSDGQIALLERGRPSLEDHLATLTRAKRPSDHAGAIVMHANPFTYGHRFLIETALVTSDIVYVFVLSERAKTPDTFSPERRLRLVQAGVAALAPERRERVVVVPSGDYLVSRATFPAYFLPDDDAAIDAQARLDATLFLTHIAPTLGLTTRFVGDEPLSPTTQRYNDVLAEVFAGHLDLVVVPRLTVDGAAVSASRVRASLKTRDWQTIRRLVPPTTYDDLNAEPCVS